MQKHLHFEVIREAAGAQFVWARKQASKRFWRIWSQSVRAAPRQTCSSPELLARSSSATAAGQSSLPRAPLLSQSSELLAGAPRIRKPPRPSSSPELLAGTLPRPSSSPGRLARAPRRNSSPELLARAPRRGASPEANAKAKAEAKTEAKL